MYERPAWLEPESYKSYEEYYKFVIGKELQIVKNAVFGNGRIKAPDVWLDLPNRNGADAAALALYGGGCYG